ncbi:hypothetical protein KJ877_09290 [bacterium]|nr:hypothetical protein [bacterium]MBU1989457.1 hypothetical protein [bacterium]
MKLSVIVFNLLFFSISLLNAEDVIIAPAPVSDDSIIGSGSQNRFTLGYMSYTSDEFELNGANVILGTRDRNGEGFVLDASASFTGLYGDTGGTDIAGAMFGGNLLFGAELGIPEAIIYAGPTLTLTSLTMDTVTVINGTVFQDTLYINTLIYGATGGLQYKMALPFGSFTPWFFASYIGGTTTMETTATSETSDIEFLTTTQFGFDLYFKAISTSLSSMYQTTKDGDLLNLSFTFHF